MEHPEYKANYTACAHVITPALCLYASCAQLFTDINYSIMYYIPFLTANWKRKLEVIFIVGHLVHSLILMKKIRMSASHSYAVRSVSRSSETIKTNFLQNNEHTILLMFEQGLKILKLNFLNG